MEVVKTSESMNPITTYLLTKSPAREKISAHDGDVIRVIGYAIYTDVDARGNENTLLSLLADDTRVYTTSSATCIRDMNDILAAGVEPSKDSPACIGIRSGMSKNNRTFYGLYLDVTAEV
jgi:hypothetical protein